VKHVHFSGRALVAGFTLAALVASISGPAQARQAGSAAHAGAGVLIFPEVISNLWVKNLDPAKMTDANSIYVTNMVFSGLVKLDGSNNVVPDLAAAMPALSADKLTYTFTLKPNLKFSDGTPVTSADVVSSITRALSKAEASPLGTLYLGLIKGAVDFNAGKIKTLPGVSAPDPQTVKITLEHPAGYFLQTLTYPTSYVLKSTDVAGTDMVGPNAQKVDIGTGPYMFSKPWRYRQEMFLASNPNWYNASKLKIKEIDVKYVADITTEYNEYLSGQIPVAQVPTSFIASVKNSPDYHQTGLLQIDYISPNVGSNSTCKPISCAPFNNLHFRRALMFAVNRNLIDSKILHGAESPLCSLIPKGIEGYADNQLCALNSFNLARAKAELALAKKDYGGKLPNEGNYTAIYPAGSKDITNEYTELQSEWADAGININVTSTPLNNWYTLVSTNYTPFVSNGWIDDYPDPQDFAENLFAKTSPYNITNYSDPQFTKLMAIGDVTAPGPDRTKAYVDAQKLLINDAAYIMVGQPLGTFRWKSNLHGFYLSSSFTFQPVNQDWTNASVS
jgi:oligopeptide transport system substrate-binding protein